LHAQSEADNEIALFTARAAEDPDDYISPTRLGVAYLRKGREEGDDSSFKKAEEALRRALAIKADHYSALVCLAEALSAQHRFREAIESAGKAARLKPEEAQAHALLGDACLEIGSPELAERHLGDLERLLPGFHVLVRRANLRFVQGRPQEAVGSLEEALSFAAGDGASAAQVSWCHTRLGEILRGTGRWVEAEWHLRAALKRVPSSLEALVQLALLREDEGAVVESAALYEKVAERMPHPEHLEALARIYAKLPDPLKARETLRRAREAYQEAIDTDNPHDWRNLARFFSDTEVDGERAAAYARKDLDLRQDVWAWDTLAWAQFRKGDLSAAAESIEKALAFGTRSAQLFHHAGEIHRALGDQEKARRFLKEALVVHPRYPRAKEVLKALESLESDPSRTPRAPQGGSG
jgi:tetratricopeptide (TPR) repeat protein